MFVFVNSVIKNLHKGYETKLLLLNVWGDSIYFKLYFYIL